MPCIADALRAPPFSPAIFFSLLFVLAASGAIFFLLTRRWTIDRPRAALADWARENGFHLRFTPATELPASLQSLSSLSAHVEILLTRQVDVLLQLTTAPKPAAKQPRWHLLIRQTDVSRLPAGLRPMGQTHSILDLFSLTDYPALLPPERFAVLASDTRMAKAMANSPARGLLPPDVGLMVHGPFVTLDFSARPFDSIEFERMEAVMEQVLPKLPASS